jgi:hypothetical protein
MVQAHIMHGRRRNVTLRLIVWRLWNGLHGIFR